MMSSIWARQTQRSSRWALARSASSSTSSLLWNTISNTFCARRSPARLCSAPMDSARSVPRGSAAAFSPACSNIASSGIVARSHMARKRSALSLKCQYTAPRVMPAAVAISDSASASRRARGKCPPPRRGDARGLPGLRPSSCAPSVARSRSTDCCPYVQIALQTSVNVCYLDSISKLHCTKTPVQIARQESFPCPIPLAHIAIRALPFALVAVLAACGKAPEAGFSRIPPAQVTTVKLVPQTLPATYGVRRADDRLQGVEVRARRDRPSWRRSCSRKAHR